MFSIVIDAESDGLLDEATVIHCICYYNLDTGESGSLTSHDEMIAFLSKESYHIIGHNVILFDSLLFKKILGIDPSLHKWTDSLGISWYIHSSKGKDYRHGLEHYGNKFGIIKPKIDDWKTLTTEEYVYRCSEDVKINTRLWEEQLRYLKLLYPNMDNIKRLLQYITFKLECIREQFEEMVKVDLNKLTSLKSTLETNINEKVNKLSQAMPTKKTYIIKKRPSVIYKKVNPTKKNPNPEPELGVRAIEWFELLNNLKLPHSTSEVQVLSSEEPGNPNSSSQLKNWLFELGWIPTFYKYVKDEDTNEQRAIPQIAEDGKICPNIVSLFEDVPALEALEGLTVMKHRLGVVEGFLEEADENSYVRASVAGFTNTFRFKHGRPIVNLPKVDLPYGKDIRGSIIAPEGYLLCGSDMSGLEAVTQDHYMYYFDPQYVIEKRTPGYDPHTELAVLAGLMTKEEEEFFKCVNKRMDSGLPVSDEEKKIFKGIKKKRHGAKTTNYACTYGAYPPKIATTAKIPLPQAKLLHVTYWKRNWSLAKISESCHVINIEGQMWLWNPVSKFYYSLRSDKDRFSTLNQSTGVFCFDTWVREVRNKGIKISLQYHDEIAFKFLEEKREEIKSILQEAITITNEKIRLNIPLSISIDIGHNYADTH